MANVSLKAAVGIRNGRTMQPNLDSDLAKVAELFDRIPVAAGGSMELGGVWSKERGALFAELTAQIVAFQTLQKRPVADGVIDPGGGTLRVMNQVAVEPGPGPKPGPGIRAETVECPAGYDEVVSSGTYVADWTTVSGTGQMKCQSVDGMYWRVLVRVEDCSIRWFGVVIPADGPLDTSSIPHVNFTPTPWQGGYLDPGYESFASWGKLWGDYTEVIGSQITAAKVKQFLVIPFYKNAQTNDLGDFLTKWREVVGAVLTAAINKLDPYALRDTYTYSEIECSSFSNGYMAHHQFYTKGMGVQAAANAIYDLDGVAGGSNWVPVKGVVYRNQMAPRGVNPQGPIYYVGGRWDEFRRIYGGPLNTHACCRNHLLYHGLRLKHG